MKKRTLVVLLIGFSKIILGQALPQKLSEADFSIGKTIHIRSSILNEARVINIYLPSSYSTDTAISYPVIYLLDGSKDEDFIHIAGIVQFGSFSWINMLPESIVVGIANVDRKRDFTYPSQNELDQKEFPTSGGSEKFIQFLGDELQPFIDRNYRTDSIRTIIGQSLGGLLTTEILMENEDLFDNYIIVSPSLWWDDEKLLERSVEDFDSKKVIYIAGGKEGEVMERTAKELFNKLNKHDPKNSRVFYEFLADKSHGDALHIAVYHAFEEIFKLKKE